MINKISTYTFLILIFLGISTTLYKSNKINKYILNEHTYSNYFNEAPLSLILIDYFSTGLLIKTYYHKYKLIRPFGTPYITTFIVSKKFWEKNSSNLGMSLYRKEHDEIEESTLPMPPGILYLGDLSYGSWIYSGSGKKIWQFHRAYKKLAYYLNWGHFRPSHDFYTKAKSHLKFKKPFYGTNKEFGSHGVITNKNNIIINNKKDKSLRYKIMAHIKSIFSFDNAIKRTLIKNKRKSINE